MECTTVTCIDWKRRNTVKHGEHHTTTPIRLFYSKITRNDTHPTICTCEFTTRFNWCDGLMLDFIFAIWFNDNFVHVWITILIPMEFVGNFDCYDNQKWLHCIYEYCLPWSWPHTKIWCVFRFGLPDAHVMASFFRDFYGFLHLICIIHSIRRRFHLQSYRFSCKEVPIYKLDDECRCSEFL